MLGAFSRYSAVPTRPAARPPNACDSAVRCGTAVIGISTAIGMPITAPSATAPAIQANDSAENRITRSVPATARTMARLPAQLPRRDERTWPIHLMDRMNSAAPAR